MVIFRQNPDSASGGEPLTSATPLGRPRGLPIAPIVVVAVLIAFGLIAWIGYRAEESMRQAHRQSLQAIQLREKQTQNWQPLRQENKHKIIVSFRFALTLSDKVRRTD